MRRSTNGHKLAPQNRAVPSSSPEEKVVRIDRPANDNLPHWAMQTGRRIMIGGAVAIALVIAALIYV